MIKNIAILGSTGSIGKSLLEIINTKRKNYKISLLSANKNYKELFKQAKVFKVKNLIVTNKKSFLNLKKICKYHNIKVFNNYDCFSKIFNKKIDYVMSSIIGLNGLKPTLKIIKFTKTIAIANKESLICGWNLIDNELKKNNTRFIPVDSEHFSIWFGLKNTNSEVEKIILTASGGPFLNLALNKFKNITINQALKHPNWKMGKKITIDSATMMNKVFEVIEAKNIFSLKYDQLSILIHPYSYIHGIIKFKNGLIKLIAHDTDMKIPIFNSINTDNNMTLKKLNKINIKALNNLELDSVNLKKFPIVKILKMMPNKNSLFETVIVSANDALVDIFLQKKIKFTEISKKLFLFIKKKEFNNYKRKKARNVDDILKLNNYVRLKINSKSI